MIYSQIFQANFKKIWFSQNLFLFTFEGTHACVTSFRLPQSVFILSASFFKIFCNWKWKLQNNILSFFCLFGFLFLLNYLDKLKTKNWKDGKHAKYISSYFLSSCLVLSIHICHAVAHKISDFMNYETDMITFW